MPYREKIAWLSLGAMALTFGPYFVLVATGILPSRPMPDLPQLGLYGLTALLSVVLLIAGRLYLRSGAPEEARIRPDERDRAIEHRSIRFAYYVLIGGMILVGCVMPFQSSGWEIIHAALFMMVAAEVVHQSVVVFSYRRQA